MNVSLIDFNQVGLPGVFVYFRPRMHVAYARTLTCRNIKVMVPVRSQFLKSYKSVYRLSRSKLDKFWKHQPIIYDFKVEILGTRSRS